MKSNPQADRYFRACVLWVQK